MTDENESQPLPPTPTPALRVQRMGRLFRFVYETTRNLALFNSGKPVDGGGFKEELEARIALSKALDKEKGSGDPEAEGIG